MAIYKSLMPVFVCSKIFGLCPFDISVKGYSKNTKDVIYPIILSILFTSHALSELYMREDDDDDLLIYTLTDNFHTYTGVFCATTIFLVSILISNKVNPL